MKTKKMKKMKKMQMDYLADLVLILLDEVMENENESENENEIDHDEVNVILNESEK